MKILVTGAARVQSGHLIRIANAGHSVDYLKHEDAELPSAASEAEVVVCNSLFHYHPVNSFPSLKLVQATSAGLDRMPLDILAQRGIQIKPARGVYSAPIAEFVVMLILQCYKHSVRLLDRQRRREWQKERGLRELTGATACIVGYGSIGQAVANRLSPFGVNIIPITRGTPSNEADRSLASSDIVILAAPLTPETYHFMDARRLGMMPRDSVLINIARGQLVEERALIELLEHGHFAGVGLDVFQTEPLPTESPLWDYERVIITPHNSFVSDQSTDNLVSLLLENIDGLR